MLEFHILGPIEVVGDGGPIRLGGTRQRVSLAILLLNANRVVSVERFADDLYAGDAPVTAVTQVQRQISELRKVLGAHVIETRAPGYMIRLSPGQLDLDVFEQRAERAREALGRGDAKLASGLLGEALASWRGAPLADLGHDSLSVAIERLEEMRLAAVEQQIDAGLALGRHTELMGELEQLVAEHPLRERFRGQLMLALYRSGRQAEALEVYRTTRQALVEALGIEPTRGLQALEHAILTQDRSLDLEGAPSASAGVVAEPDRTVLVLPSADEPLRRLLAVAEPLARLPRRELMIASLVPHERELEGAVSALSAVRARRRSERERRRSPHRSRHVTPSASPLHMTSTSFCSMLRAVSTAIACRTISQ
jgi:DNA-binding SARP family transcriptional activator